MVVSIGFCFCFVLILCLLYIFYEDIDDFWCVYVCLSNFVLIVGDYL